MTVLVNEQIFVDRSGHHNFKEMVRGYREYIKDDSE